MMNLAATLAALQVAPGSLAIAWLGQAGFALKLSNHQLIYVDAYLSNMCETTLRGGVLSKRLLPPPLEASDVTGGLWVCTHCHQDHLDEESIAQLVTRAPQVSFAGPISCLRALQRLGVPPARMRLLAPGQVTEFGRMATSGFSLRAVYANHGDSEPDAIGLVLETDGIRLYHTGDTCYQPERMQEVMALSPDIIIPCINGMFGNLNATEAARLAHEVRARTAIPCHFWLFAGQNTRADGTPAAFLEACRAYAPEMVPVVLAVGEVFTYSRRR